MKYCENFQDTSVQDVTDPITLAKSLSIPANVDTKTKFHKWCGSKKTKHAFLTHNIASAPGKRVSSSNPVVETTGFIADYDAPADLTKLKKQINTICPTGKRPRFISKTFSDCLRIVWEFDTPLRMDPSYYSEFAKQLASALGCAKIAKGIDTCYENPAQVYAIGHDWEDLGDTVSVDVPIGALSRAFDKQKTPGDIVEIPIDVVAAEVERRFPNRWVGEFTPGSRGPLFWIDDKVDRTGCRVDTDGRGVVVFSTREAKGFMSWRDIFGPKFVEDYAVKKTAPILDSWFHDGRQYYRKGMDQVPESVSEKNAPVDMEVLGFSRERPKEAKLSECEKILHKIRTLNRVDAAAPVLYAPGLRVTGPSGNRFLNTNRSHALEPADNGDPSKWPWIQDWLTQLFGKADSKPAFDYFIAWLARFYSATLKKEIKQGQALILVGPTGVGKTLLADKVLGDLCGGFEDASDFLAGKTSFNGALTGVGVWSVQDTESAASYREHQTMTERIKKYTANPHIEYQPKFVERVTIPWGGRIVVSLNEDPNSLSVIPSLDSSNRDKIMALRVSPKARKEFPPHEVITGIMAAELPHFAKFLVDYKIPKELKGDNRFGVATFIDSFIDRAAFDNSPRSYVAGLLDKFCIRQRNDDDFIPGKPWMGKIDEIVDHFVFDASARGIKPEMWRRSLAAMAEACSINDSLRPIHSVDTPNGQFWIIDVGEQYDIMREDIMQNALESFLTATPAPKNSEQVNSPVES